MAASKQKIAALQFRAKYPADPSTHNRHFWSLITSHTQQWLKIPSNERKTVDVSLKQPQKPQISDRSRPQHALAGAIHFT
ncbi:MULTISPECIES: hypothetical protein [unclassified Novosphingobium]|uniref:hypothetical protein n=1 Tax=unclassified Novosphingobium TaxID=2644732 RepID=UPI0025CCA260|nr:MULTISPECIES: hypothetical protein [unclassified Novosphingobium]MDR6708728.1 hypothetical protein [Novosphingobium sp. 1748]